MKKIVNISSEDVLPSSQALFEAQGIPKWVKPDERTQELAREAIAICEDLSRPIGLLAEIGKDALRPLFKGIGKNEADSPVGPIIEGSDHLALFAVTLGETVCSEISQRFQTHDYALGSMLDSAASEATEMAGVILQSVYMYDLETRGHYKSHHGILRFSPGYCGWHLSGQRKLFEFLHPDEISISLNDSFLMKPIKSISGVIIVGAKEIFEFDDTFSFCRDCTTHTCRDRIKTLMKQ